MANEITATAFFSLLLLAIQDKFKNDIPEIKWVDQDFYQLENYEIRPPVEFPCVLVDFSTTTYDMLSGNEQWGNQHIQFKLAFAPFSNSHSEEPISYRQKAIEYYELEQKIFKKLQAWDGGGLCQPMTRISAVSQQGRGDAYRVRVITFTTAFNDDDATLETVKNARPGLALDIDDDSE